MASSHRDASPPRHHWTSAEAESLALPSSDLCHPLRATVLRCTHDSKPISSNDRPNNAPQDFWTSAEAEALALFSESNRYPRGKNGFQAEQGHFCAILPTVHARSASCKNEINAPLDIVEVGLLAALARTKRYTLGQNSCHVAELGATFSNLDRYGSALVNVIVRRITFMPGIH